MSADQKLEPLQSTMPPPAEAVGVYRPAILVGNLLYTSGHLPLLPDGQLITGCIGRNADVQAGFHAARQSGLAILSTAKHVLGSCDRIRRVVKIFGLVNCTADFTSHPQVLNGCSELMQDIFGDEYGIGVRSAVGTNSLPLGAMVEIEAIFELVD